MCMFDVTLEADMHSCVFGWILTARAHVCSSGLTSRLDYKHIRMEKTGGAGREPLPSDNVEFNG